MPARVIATLFAFASFAACLTYGAWIGQPVDTLIINAIVVLIACYAVGRIGGYVAQRCVDDHVQHIKDGNPIPEESGFEGEIPSAAVSSSTAASGTN